MQQVEQAIFADHRFAAVPGRSDGAAGYRVVAASAGLAEADARELAVWGPSQDSLLDPGPEGESLNFHPLPSGAYCISRTVVVDWECHNGRQPVETHCLIVPREVLSRFGNNPFALVHAVSWQALRDEARDGTAEPRPVLRSGTCHPPQRLSPVVVPGGGAAAVDQALLAFLAADPGPEEIAALVQAARGTICLAVAAGHHSAALMAGLLNCLPPECRLEFSFSTGLKFSPRRAFRLVALSGDPAQRCWVAQYPNVAVLDVRAAASPPAMPLDGWAQLIQRSLASGQIPLLAAELSKRRFHLTLDDLPALGLQLLEALDASKLRACSAHAAHRRFAGSNLPDVEQVGNLPPSARQVANRPHNEPADLPHNAAGRSACLDLNSPEMLDRLEHLDDLVYDAINGQPGAMEQLRTAWPALADTLGEAPLAESREQYLRYALSVWEQSAKADGLRRPDQAIQALDVLCLLFGEAT